MFKHFLITRFNLKNSSWKFDKKNTAVLTDQWHDNRFKLFTEYCFESVSSQTNNNFEWLVYFDTTTPQKYKDYVATLKKKMSNFTPIYIDGMDKFLPEIKSYVANSTEDYIITSRIDNDDCISKFYIEEIQKRFNKQDFMAIDFVEGYTLQIQPDVKLAKRLDQFNPFITLIEKNINPKTVWSVAKHSHWKRVKNITQIRGVKLWTAIIHKENKINDFAGYGNVDIDMFFKNFMINDDQVNFIKSNLIPQNEWKLLSIKNAYRSYTNLYYKSLKKSIGLYQIK